MLQLEEGLVLPRQVPQCSRAVQVSLTEKSTLYSCGTLDIVLCVDDVFLFVFRCNVCGKEFFEKALFRRHVKKATHGKKGRVKQNLERECEQCGRKFTQLREYRRHVNNHQGETVSTTGGRMNAVVVGAHLHHLLVSFSIRSETI